MANKFRLPEVTFMGRNAVAAAEEELAKLGEKALIVSGKSMIRQGNVSVIQGMLEKHGVSSVVFSEIPGEPTDQMVEAGHEVYQKEGCDFIIGIGGGSPLDSAKAIGILATSGGRISDYNGKVIRETLPPLVAIPSTAGTGSETTPFTIVTDTEKDIKMLLKGDSLMPKIAIVDPALSMKTPRSVTVATGLDALTRAVEAYTSFYDGYHEEVHEVFVYDITEEMRGGVQPDSDDAVKILLPRVSDRLGSRAGKE